MTWPLLAITYLSTNRILIMPDSHVTLLFLSLFQVQLEIQKLRKINPFAAISSKREAAPKSLFGLQIHRSDLIPVKVIGYGQFGEV